MAASMGSKRSGGCGVVDGVLYALQGSDGSNRLSIVSGVRRGGEQGIRGRVHGQRASGGVRRRGHARPALAAELRDGRPGDEVCATRTCTRELGEAGFRRRRHAP